MKQIRLVILLIGVALISALPLQARDNDYCATITARHYYARGVHNDYLVHDIGLCLSDTAKSITYELPPLSEPLYLRATDGYQIRVVITEVDSPEDVLMSLAGESVMVSLPETDPATRYQMTVIVSNNSQGIIEGSIDGQVVGRILLLDSHTRFSDSLVASLGGLSGEWWFETTNRPQNSSLRFALIDEPTPQGNYAVGEAGWNNIPRTSANNPLVVAGEDWLAGGYFAIRLTLR